MDTINFIIINDQKNKSQAVKIKKKHRTLLKCQHFEIAHNINLVCTIPIKDKKVTV
jgi:hypothetical protein